MDIKRRYIQIVLYVKNLVPQKKNVKNSYQE